MKSKTRHVDGGSGSPRVHEKILENQNWGKKRRFNIDIQIQIDKPTQRETHMKSKTRHVDGEAENQQFEAFPI